MHPLRVADAEGIGSSSETIGELAPSLAPFEQDRQIGERGGIGGFEAQQSAQTVDRLGVPAHGAQELGAAKLAQVTGILAGEVVERRELECRVARRTRASGEGLEQLHVGSASFERRGEVGQRVTGTVQLSGEKETELSLPLALALARLAPRDLDGQGCGRLGGSTETIIGLRQQGESLLIRGLGGGASVELDGALGISESLLPELRGLLQESSA